MEPENEEVQKKMAMMARRLAPEALDDDPKVLRVAVVNNLTGDVAESWVRPGTTVGELFEIWSVRNPDPGFPHQKHPETTSQVVTRVSTWTRGLTSQEQSWRPFMPGPQYRLRDRDLVLWTRREVLTD